MTLSITATKYDIQHNGTICIFINIIKYLLVSWNILNSGKVFTIIKQAILLQRGKKSTPKSFIRTAQDNAHKY
jgi:hypothetical protein